MPQEPKSTVIAVRVPSEQRAQLEALVQTLNDEAFTQGRAPVHTVSSILQQALFDYLKANAHRVAPPPPAQALSEAPNVLAAIERLRSAK